MSFSMEKGTTPAVHTNDTRSANHALADLEQPFLETAGDRRSAPRSACGSVGSASETVNRSRTLDKKSAEFDIDYMIHAHRRSSGDLSFKEDVFDVPAKAHLHTPVNRQKMICCGIAVSLWIMVSVLPIFDKPEMPVTSTGGIRFVAFPLERFTGGHNLSDCLVNRTYSEDEATPPTGRCLLLRRFECRACPPRPRA